LVINCSYRLGDFPVTHPAVSEHLVIEETFKISQPNGRPWHTRVIVLPLVTVTNHNEEENSNTVR